MLIVRSLAFNVLFYVNLLAHMIVALPTFVLPQRALIAIAKSWGRTSLWLLRVVCDIRVEWRGLDKIPQGPLIVAAKHHSAWETFALLDLFDYPLYILKRELMWIPIFGWYTWKGGMIPVNRAAGKIVLPTLAVRVRQAMKEGRQLLIFPEGTRRPAGAEPSYKWGVAYLYGESGVPCLPVALNSGLFWPRRSFLRHPGTVIVQVLDPIPPGLDRTTFLECLKDDIEAATNRILAESGRVPDRVNV